MMARAAVRCLGVVLVALELAACSTDSPRIRAHSDLHDASIDSVAQFLLTTAATDFHNHRPPDPVRFRDVRLGHVKTPSGELQYILCGQFLPEQEAGHAQWTDFATIKTSGYEQCIGRQATVFCQDSSVLWEKTGDLSSSLQSRFDSLR